MRADAGNGVLGLWAFSSDGSLLSRHQEVRDQLRDGGGWEKPGETGEWQSGSVKCP